MGVFQRAAMAAILTGLASCVTAAAPQEQQDRADRIVNACLDRMALRLDDGRSDALTVAYAIAGACNAEIESRIRLMTQTYDGLEYARRRFGGVFLKAATETVLLNRAKAKGKGQ